MESVRPESKPVQEGAPAAEAHVQRRTKAGKNRRRVDLRRFIDIRYADLAILLGFEVPHRQ